MEFFATETGSARKLGRRCFSVDIQLELEQKKYREQKEVFLRCN